MVVKLFGTGSILTSHASSCFLIDQHILVDCPNGIIKTFRKAEIRPNDIDICIITHFHADHYFDVPFLLLEHALATTSNDLLFIGPKGIYQHIRALFNLAYPEDWEMVEKKTQFKTIEVQDSLTFQVGNYKLTSYKMIHSCCDAYGYTIKKDGRTVGFTGDTIMCDSVKKIITESNIVFADMSFKKGSKAHMGMDDVLGLMEKFGSEHKIVPTHMTDEVRHAFGEIAFIPPTENDSFIL